MSIFRIVFSAILLIALTGCVKNHDEPTIDKMQELLEKLPGVHSVEELASRDYKKHYLILFKQQLDPKNPAAGTFLQRVFLSHQDFDSPVVFETEGYDAEGSMTNTYQSELTERYQANRVEVEYRYSGLSNPSSKDWKYLTCENAAADLHAVRTALGMHYTSSWIATGASKGGTNAMTYSMYYPDDMTATVAYVGPICNSLEDTRFVDHLNSVGTPEMRKKILDFQKEILIRRDRIQPQIYTTPAEPTHAREYMSNDQSYELLAVDFSFGVWQKGLDIDNIPGVNATDQQIVDYLMDEDNSSNPYLLPMSRKKDRSYIFVGDYLRNLKVHLTKAEDEPDLSLTHYYVQTLIELGGSAQNIGVLEHLMPNHKSWSVNHTARFVVPASAADIQFSDKLSLQLNQWLREGDPRLICIYGEYDPWTAAAPDKGYFAGKSNMLIFTQKGGSHSAEIEKLSSADKQQAWANLDSWVKNKL